MTHEPPSANDQPQPPEQPRPRIVTWRCPNCGQLYFCGDDETPPDVCQYCRDMTTWQKLSVTP